MKRIAWVILLIVILLAAVLVVTRFTHPKDVDGDMAEKDAAEVATPPKGAEQAADDETGSQQADGIDSYNSQSQAEKAADKAEEDPEVETPTEITVTDEFVIEVDETENVDGF